MEKFETWCTLCSNMHKSSRILSHRYTNQSMVFGGGVASWKHQLGLDAPSLFGGRSKPCSILHQDDSTSWVWFWCERNWWPLPQKNQHWDATDLQEFWALGFRNLTRFDFIASEILSFLCVTKRVDRALFEWKTSIFKKSFDLSLTQDVLTASSFDRQELFNIWHWRICWT